MGKEVIKLKPKFPKPTKVEQLKVAAYARVSTEKDEQHNSLEAQKDYFLKYIKMNWNGSMSGYIMTMEFLDLVKRIEMVFLIKSLNLFFILLSEEKGGTKYEQIYFRNK